MSISDRICKTILSKYFCQFSIRIQYICNSMQLLTLISSTRKKSCQSSGKSCSLFTTSLTLVFSGFFSFGLSLDEADNDAQLFNSAYLKVSKCVEAHFPWAHLSLCHLAVGLEHTPNMAVYETTLSTYWNPEKNNRCLGRSTNELGYLWTLQQDYIPSELVMPCMSFPYYQQPMCWRIDDIFSLKRAETLLTWMGEKWWPTTVSNTLFAIIWELFWQNGAIIYLPKISDHLD